MCQRKSAGVGVLPQDAHWAWPVVNLHLLPADLTADNGCGDGEERVPSMDPAWRTTTIPVGMDVEFLANDGSVIPGIRGSSDSDDGWRTTPDFDHDLHGRKIGVLVWRPKQAKPEEVSGHE